MSSFFFFNDTATTEIYTLSLHDALPISRLMIASILLVALLTPGIRAQNPSFRIGAEAAVGVQFSGPISVAAGDFKDRKSTRLNSSHQIISYAVFCLKKKKTKTKTYNMLR